MGWHDILLSPIEFLSLSEDKNGREILKNYIKRSRAAFTTHEAVRYLDESDLFKRPLTEEEWNHLCNRVHTCIFEIDQQVVLDWLQDMVAKLDDQNYIPEYVNDGLLM
jgi:hypothetical protein